MTPVMRCLVSNFGMANSRGAPWSYQWGAPVTKPDLGVTVVGTLLFLLVSSCALSQVAPASSSKSADEDDIYALVIQSQMEQWVRDGDKSEAEAKTKSDKSIAKFLNFRTFFVEVNGKDPSNEFLARFHNIPRTVKKVSDAIPEKVPHTPVDRATNHMGIIFSAEKLRWIDKDSVEVEGGYYCGGLCAAGITFRVKRENGKWRIKSSQMNWIS
jgi:hypothetical protein